MLSSNSLSPNNIHYNNSTNNNSSSMLKPDPLPCRPPPSPPWSAQPRPGHWPPTSSLSSISSPPLFNHAPPQLLFISSSAHTATTRPNTTISVRHHLAAGRTVVHHPRSLTPLAAGVTARTSSAQQFATAAVRGSSACLRARTCCPPPAPPPPWSVGTPSPGPGAHMGLLPWRPTSSGTRRRGDSCVLNEIPSACASLELKICAPSQQLHACFPENPTVGSAISSLRRNLVLRGQLRQLVSPPLQLRLVCYQFLRS
ncbi:putative LRR receptor-like serine/threonine-protein kinase [Iris pallida]|uniref:LRR receptor-like serine/threonine-protein kinase n=1 Tax=Iris pallida TaxID=29817 RepID=A0AAX6FFW4_IRIPA|nr:putative LRR receptor-like serine/threonine-protein kinase [Iris pallida]